LLSRAIDQAKIQVVERDLRNFQSNLPDVLSRVHGLTRKVVTGKANFPGLSAWLPAMNCLSVLFSNSIEGVLNPNSAIEKGIAKFFLAKGVFTQESSKSKIQGESAVVKSLIRLIETASG